MCLRRRSRVLRCASLRCASAMNRRSISRLNCDCATSRSMTAVSRSPRYCAPICRSSLIRSPACVIAFASWRARIASVNTAAVAAMSPPPRSQTRAVTRVTPQSERRAIVRASAPIRSSQGGLSHTKCTRRSSREVPRPRGGRQVQPLRHVQIRPHACAAPHLHRRRPSSRDHRSTSASAIDSLALALLALLRLSIIRRNERVEDEVDISHHAPHSHAPKPAAPMANTSA
jgi:hypothetical protein